jgi:hypothetical protein
VLSVVGLLDTLLGKKKLKGANLDRLFAISTARVTLEVELGLRPAGAGALIFKPLSAGEFVRVENEIQALLEVAARESGSDVRRQEDTYGYTWLIVRDPDFEDLVTATHLVSSELQARGFGEQLLAAVFRFDGGRHPVYLLYGYKRATFWPFVPTGEEQKRDNAEELRLKNELEKELPIEDDLSRWFGLFDSPV